MFYETWHNNLEIRNNIAISSLNLNLNLIATLTQILAKEILPAVGNFSILTYKTPHKSDPFFNLYVCTRG